MTTTKITVRARPADRLKFKRAAKKLNITQDHLFLAMLYYVDDIITKYHE